MNPECVAFESFPLTKIPSSDNHEYVDSGLSNMMIVGTWLARLLNDWNSQNCTLKIILSSVHWLLVYTLRFFSRARLCESRFPDFNRDSANNLSGCLATKHDLLILGFYLLRSQEIRMPTSQLCGSRLKLAEIRHSNLSVYVDCSDVVILVILTINELFTYMQNKYQNRL